MIYARPLSILMMVSAYERVSVRCAIMMMNFMLDFSFKLANSLRSLMPSRAEVPSSKISISGYLSTALAMAMRCFCPPLKALNSESRPMFLMNYSAQQRPSVLQIASSPLLLNPTTYLTVFPSSTGYCPT